MPRFKVAHIREQGQDIIMVPLESSFGYKPESEQSAIIDELQAHASGAGLRGTIVPIWDDGGGRMKFIAPRPWHPFFQGLSLASVYANLNREIYW